MKRLFNTKFIITILCILLSSSSLIFATENKVDNIVDEIESEIDTEEIDDVLSEDDESMYGYQSYEDMMRKSVLQDDTVPMEERVYSEYNIPLDLFKGLSQRVILSMYSTNFNFDDMAKLYDGMGYTKTASFIRALDNITTDKTKAPNIKSNECYIHNGKYETRSVLVFANGDTATVNIAYEKTIPYLYFADNVDFYMEGIGFDIVNKSMNVLDDYCVTKGENLSQYADMDEFIRNFVIVIIAILLLIIIVSRLNKTNTSSSNTKTNTKTITTAGTSNDTELVAILTAAIAQYEQKSVDGIRIKTIRKNIRWKNI